MPSARFIDSSFIYPFVLLKTDTFSFFLFFLIMTWPRIVSEYETVAGSMTLVPVVD